MPALLHEGGGGTKVQPLRRFIPKSPRKVSFLFLRAFTRGFVLILFWKQSIFTINYLDQSILTRRQKTLRDEPSNLLESGALTFDQHRSPEGHLYTAPNMAVFPYITLDMFFLKTKYQLNLFTFLKMRSLTMPSRHSTDWKMLLVLAVPWMPMSPIPIFIW